MNYSPEQVVRMQVLAAVVNLAAGRTGQSVSVDDLVTALEDGTPLSRHEIAEHIELLEQSHFVEGFHSLAGLMSVFLLPQGKDAASQFARDAQNPVQRMNHLQDDYLRWLYVEIELNGGAPTPDGYLATSPAYLGLPYTDVELQRAGNRLVENKLISGPKAWGYDAPLRPILTPLGRQCIERNQSVRTLTAEPTPSIVNVHGNANVAIGSSHVKQSMSIDTETARALLQSLEAVRQAVPLLPAALQDQIQTLTAESVAALEKNESSKFMTAIKALTGALKDTATGALGNVLGNQLLGLASSLGG